MTTRTKTGFYLYRFFSDFTPIYALYPIFFKLVGLGEALISALFMTLVLSTLAFELPTGIIADKVDRRVILAFSAFTKALGFLVWLIWPHSIGLIIGIVLWGLGMSFESGCWQALIYDELASQKKEHEFGRLVAGTLGISFAAILLSSLAGAVIFQYHQNYFLVILISVIALCLAGLVPAIFPKAAPNEAVASASIKTHLAEALHAWRLSPNARWIILSAAMLGGIKGSLDEYHGLYLSDKLIDTSLIPLFYAGFTFMGMVVFFWLSRKKKVTKESDLAFLMCGVGFLLFSVIYLPVWMSVIMLLLMSALDSMFRVDNESLLQSSITSTAMRATISSAASFCQQLVSLAVFGTFGLIVTHLTLSWLYGLGGAILFCVALYKIRTTK